MKKLNDLINNLETYKELTTVPRDTLIKELKECKAELTEQCDIHVVGNWFNGLNETPSEERLNFSRFVLVKHDNGLYKVDRYDYLHNMWMASAWDKNETKWMDLPS